jgi:hypothetical protein
MEHNDLPDHLRELRENLKDEPIDTCEETKVFELTLVIEETLVPCEVFFARATDGSTFTRAVFYAGTQLEAMLDIDKWEDGWIDMYTGEFSAWSTAVGAAIDYKISEIKSGR